MSRMLYSWSMLAPLQAPRRVALWTATWGLLTAASGFPLWSGEWSTRMRILLSVVPVIPMGVPGFLAVRGIRCLDELEARVHFEGAMTGSVAVKLGVMLAGLLTTAGILPFWPLGRGWPWLRIGGSLCWIGQAWTAGRRYRRGVSGGPGCRRRWPGCALLGCYLQSLTLERRPS
jgi:hypothetical protein